MKRLDRFTLFVDQDGSTDDESVIEVNEIPRNADDRQHPGEIIPKKLVSVRISGRRRKNNG